MSCLHNRMEHLLYDNTRSQYIAEITKRKRETQNISKLQKTMVPNPFNSATLPNQTFT